MLPTWRVALVAWIAGVGCGDEAPGQPEVSDIRDVTPDEIDAVDSVDALEVPETTPDAPDAADTRDPDADPERPVDRHEDRAPASGPLRAGIASLLLDVPVGISMGGYQGRTGPGQSTWADMFFPSIGAHGRLALKAVAFEVGGEQLVLVKLPLVFSEDSLTHEMTRQLERRHGLLLAGRVITAATHTHAGPARFWRVPGPLGASGIDSPDDEVVALIAGQMADVVAAAIADLGPAEWGYTITNDWDTDDRVYRDRRPANDTRWGKDPRLTVLGVRRPDGAPLALVTNFAMHGTILGSDNAMLSEDAAGGLEHGVEAAFFRRHGRSIMTMFTQAGGGDAAPTGGSLGHQGEQRMPMIGVAAAPTVLDLWDGLTWTSTTELAVRSRQIDIRHAWIYGDSHEFDDLDGNPYRWGTILCSIDPLSGKSQKGQAKSCFGLHNFIEGLGITMPHHELNQTYLTVARLGPLFFLTIPGEPTHSLAEYARERVAELVSNGSPSRAPGAPRDVMVLGYSQDHLLYLTHPDDWYFGGYEAEFSLWGPWAGRWLVDRQLAIVAAMLAGRNGPTYDEELDDLATPLAETRRAPEPSLDLGQVAVQPAASVERLGIVRVVVSGGDPRFGVPRFALEVEEGGEFVAVVDDTGRSTDNRSPASLTRYDPIPAASQERIARDHRWEWTWQVPPHLPTGRYRVVVRGTAFVTDEETWSTTTDIFTVIESSRAALAVNALEGSRWRVSLTFPPEPLVMDAGNRAPIRGWSVFDDTARATEPIRVKAPLSLSFERDATTLGQPVVVTWDEAIGGHVLDASTLGFEPAGATLRAKLTTDRSDRAGDGVAVGWPSR